jgi:hypothetical protein
MSESTGRTGECPEPFVRTQTPHANEEWQQRSESDVDRPKPSDKRLDARYPHYGNIEMTDSEIDGQKPLY